MIHLKQMFAQGMRPGITSKMSGPREKTKALGPVGAVGCLAVLILLVVLDAPGHWQAVPVLLGCAFGAGCVCGHFQAKAFARRVGSAVAPAVRRSPVVTAEEQAKEPDVRREARVEMLRGLLDELTQMQKENDLRRRYQCFLRVIESVLRETVGPCGVSLWVPDTEHENIIECLIRPKHSSEHNRGSLAGARMGREPFSLPIDSANIRRSLQTGRPFLVERSGLNGIVAGHSPTVALRHDGCIPLCREYGEPLLVILEHTKGGIKSSRRKEFDSAVEMIEMFWNHLQVTNQREWMVEHDPATEAVRADAFLNGAQSWVDDLHRRDELFTVVAITVQGFRRMFAGTSQKWQNLYSTVCRSVNRIFTERGDEFMLGTMADDVLAVLLPGKDTFICRAVMSAVMKKLQDELRSARGEGLSGIAAVNIQWRLADHNEYCGSIQGMLDQAYGDLFRQDGNDVDNHACHIDLERTEAPVT